MLQCVRAFYKNVKCASDGSFGTAGVEGYMRRVGVNDKQGANVAAVDRFHADLHSPSQPLILASSKWGLAAP